MHRPSVVRPRSYLKISVDPKVFLKSIQPHICLLNLTIPCYEIHVTDLWETWLQRNHLINTYSEISPRSQIYLHGLRVRVQGQQRCTGRCRRAFNSDIEIKILFYKVAPPWKHATFDMFWFCDAPKVVCFKENQLWKTVFLYRYRRWAYLTSRINSMVSLKSFHL